MPATLTLSLAFCPHRIPLWRANLQLADLLMDLVIDKNGFPKWLGISWWLIYPGATGLVARLLYETVYLTWKYGPQLVGYELVHVYPLSFLIGALSWLLAWPWLIIAAVLIALNRVRLRKLDWIQFVLMFLTLLMLCVPAKWWQALMSYF